MNADIDFDPVDRITVGAVGEAGSRTFLIQAEQSGKIVTLILEKQDVAALSRGSYDLLTHIGGQEMVQELLGIGGLGTSTPEFVELMALQANEPIWRVGSIALGYEESNDRIVIVCEEMVLEGEDAAKARFWLTRKQLTSLAIHGMTVSAQGRPICPLCGLVMENDDHVCPTNGYAASRYPAE